MHPFSPVRFLCFLLLFHLPGAPLLPLPFVPFEGGNVLSKPKIVERLIAHRFFKRKSKDPESYAFFKASGHKKLYAESILTLNEAAAAKAGDPGPYLMPMCLPVRAQMQTI